MPTIKSSLYFSFNGKKSTDFGIYNVSIDSSMYKESFIPTRVINEQKIRGRDKPYFQSIEYSPLEFDLTFAFENAWDDDLIRKVARWLNVDYFKELYFDENINRIYFAMPIDSPEIIHNGLKSGYITIKMRCNGAYSYSPTYTKDYDFTSGTGTFVFPNSGDVTCKPELWITKKGAGDVSIVNRSNGSIEFKFTGLSDGEIVYVDNENEQIESSLTNVYRYNAFNFNFLEALYGNNTFDVTGACSITLRYRFKTLQG